MFAMLNGGFPKPARGCGSSVCRADVLRRFLSGTISDLTCLTTRRELFYAVPEREALSCGLLPSTMSFKTKKLASQVLNRGYCLRAPGTLPDPSEFGRFLQVPVPSTFPDGVWVRYLKNTILGDIGTLLGDHFLDFTVFQVPVFWPFRAKDVL